MRIVDLGVVQLSDSNNPNKNVDNIIPTQYDKPASIEPSILIAEVQKYPMLYNNLLPEYKFTIGSRRSEVWDLINQAIFPQYNQLDEETKAVISKTVRKRWKSLRDGLVKDYRMRTENPEMKKRKMSKTMKELQFLIPYIRVRGSDSIDGKHSPDFLKLLHDENDQTIDLISNEDSTEGSYCEINDDVTVKNEALYPSVHLTTSEDDLEEVNVYREELPFANSLIYENKTSNYDIEDDEFNVVATENLSKRRRTEGSRDDIHSKFNELVQRYSEETKDEDRMFLLSLLSDFKRVPIQKKLKVKTQFIAALSEAL